MPALQEISLEMHALHSVQESSELQELWHYEFECGFGVPLLKKYRAHNVVQSPQTRKTPETAALKMHQHCRVEAWR
jgi:hypothetical protein